MVLGWIQRLSFGIGGAQGVGNHGTRTLPEQVLEESTVQPEDVRLQQKADGTLFQLGSGSFGKVRTSTRHGLHYTDRVSAIH